MISLMLSLGDKAGKTCCVAVASTAYGQQGIEGDGRMREGGQRLKEKQQTLPKPHQHPPVQLFTLGEFFIFDCSSVPFCLPRVLLGQIIETGQFTSLSFLDSFTFSFFCTNNMLQFGGCKGCREILISSQ